MQLLLTAVLIIAAVGVYSVEDYSFTHYVFTQQWPTPFRPSSSFAANITKWTIHGLWPSVNESYPANCNLTWNLNESDIAPVEDSLRAQWPSFSGSDMKFWGHEWRKHGTCAASIPSLSGPFKFFSYALQLNNKYNMENILASAPNKIVPTNETHYYYNDFLEAGRAMFNETLILGCIYDENTKSHHIAQIEICLNKEFQLGCSPNMISKLESAKKMSKVKGIPFIGFCSKTEPIYYHPIPH